MSEAIPIRGLDEAEMAINVLRVQMAQLQRDVVDHRERFETLQTPLWKRIWFRIDGWPGQCNLNAEQRAWRPWH
jgi:hypothetical protein